MWKLPLKQIFRKSFNGCVSVHNTVSMKYLLAILIPALASTSLAGQSGDTLTLASALRIGMENNFAIRLVKKDAEIANNNVSLENAGFLPVVNLNAGQTFNVQNVEQQFITGNENNVNGAKSDAFNAGVDLGWRLFDGMQMFVRYDRLKGLKEMGETQTQITLENQIAQITALYYQLAQQQQRIRVLEENLTLTRERVSLAKEKFDLGAASEREYLLAQVDENTDRSLLIEQEVLVEQTRIQLNRLMGREPSTLFEVSREIPLIDPLALDDLYAALANQNPNIALARQELQQAHLDYKEVKARRLPFLDFNLGYNFNRSTSEAGFLLSNQVLGLNYGFTLGVNLLDGFSIKRQMQNARVNMEIQELEIEDLQHQLQTDLVQIYQAYQTNLRLLDLEQENLAVSRRNLDISRQTYEFGNLSAIEYREAQRNHVETGIRLITARIQVKLTEIELLRLSGRIGEVL